MDKQTLSNYGWVIITVLVLAVMIALATPFGSYIKEGAKSTLTGLFESSENALNTGLNEAGVTLNKAEFGETPTVNNSNKQPEKPKNEGSATFSRCVIDTTCHPDRIYHSDGCYADLSEPITLTWDELKLEENGKKYAYNASAITDTSIGDKAFLECYGLIQISLPDSLCSIGENAFHTCMQLLLSDARLPENITHLGESAFCQTASITEIIIPNKITELPDRVFNAMYMLKNVTIPNSVTSIGYNIFDMCGNLETITYTGTIEEWNNITKNSSWCTSYHNTGIITIECTDGSITLTV